MARPPGRLEQCRAIYEREQTMELPNEKNVLNALTQYEAMWELQQTTGTKTDRARSKILRGLNDQDLTALAVILKRRGMIGGPK
jgi:hypothetical protein